MRVFMTGATGFIGSALVPELIGAGHQVLGLTRSDAGAKALAAAGAEVHHGSLEDLDSLKRGAAAADAVIHLAFIHDFSKFEESCEIDRRAIEALGSVLKGSERPLIATGGTGLLAPGRLATEDDKPAGHFPRLSEAAALALAADGVNASVMRLPQVHDTAKQGLVTYTIMIFRQKGACAYVGDGHQRWPAAHVTDVAHLYRLAIEKAQAGAIYHAVAEEGVSSFDIANTLGKRLQLPVKSIAAGEAPAFFGEWLARFTTFDLPASGEQTKKKLGWQPTHRGLIADLEELQVA
jgi:nucleoside-diphosphate-sugar epimerase